MPSEWICKLTNNKKEDKENQLQYIKNLIKTTWY